MSGGPEAYFGFSVAFNVALDVSIGAAYFEDVNNDGRTDFVSDGSVLFNTDDGTGGVRFSSSSEGTAVPVVRGADVDLTGIQALQDVNEQQRALSPLQDVVRRWVAPWDGSVAVTGDVTFSPPDLPQTPSPAYASDGVRVAVQHEGDERWSARLTTPGQTVTPTGVDGVQVQRGQVLYFRVGSVEDGVRDRVEWEPVVSYTAVSRVPGQAPVAVDASIPEDANGLDQTVFDAAAEFTLAGRPGTPVVMPVRGTVRLEGELTKSAVTSDDLALIVEKDGVVVVDEPIDGRVRRHPRPAGGLRRHRAHGGHRTRRVPDLRRRPGRRPRRGHGPPSTRPWWTSGPGCTTPTPSTARAPRCPPRRTCRTTPPVCPVATGSPTWTLRAGSSASSRSTCRGTSTCTRCRTASSRSRRGTPRPTQTRPSGRACRCAARRRPARRCSPSSSGPRTAARPR